GETDVLREAQSAAVPALYLDFWTICGQVNNVTVYFRIHDPPEDHKGTEISPAYAICQRDVVVNSIVAELTPEEVPQLEPVAVISPRDVVAHHRIGRAAIEVEATAICLIVRVVVV